MTNSPIKQWSIPTRERALDALSDMPRGERAGSIRQPFPVTPKADYAQLVKGTGIWERAKTAPIETVKLSDLNGIQNTVNKERVKQYIEDPADEATRKNEHPGPIDKILVVTKNGRLYIHDGHHRATAALLEGKATISARVVDLDKDESK